MIKLSKKELRILHELERNSRQTLLSIAKKCVLSKETVNYHIKKLEKQGVIKEYYLVIDKSRLGLSSHRLYIKQKRLDPQMERGLIKFAKSDPDVWAFGRTSGEMDFVIGVSKKDEYEFGNFIDELLARFGQDIKWLSTQIFLEYAEYTREYLTKEPKMNLMMISGREKAKYDETDLRILDELRKDSTAPFSEIAKKVGLSERIVRYRVKRMEDVGIIVAYRCNIDYGILGYDYFKIDLFLDERKDIAKIRKFVNSLPQTVYSERTIYHSDVEFDIEVKGIDELLSTVQLVNEKFPGAIKEFKYYSMLEYYK
jgi:DNA-binding Lrp family transcriptional regulator